jgi:hypothetical protein
LRCVCDAPPSIVSGSFSEKYDEVNLEAIIAGELPLGIDVNPDSPTSELFLIRSHSILRTDSEFNSPELFVQFRKSANPISQAIPLDSNTWLIPRIALINGVNLRIVEYRAVLLDLRREEFVQLPSQLQHVSIGFGRGPSKDEYTYTFLVQIQGRIYVYGIRKLDEL